MLSVSEPSAPRLKTTLGPRSASSTGGPGPVFRLRHLKGSSRLQAGPAPSNSTLQLVTRAGFGPVFSAPKPHGNPGGILGFRRQTSPQPVPQPADGVLVSEPIWERPAGPKTHSRRTGRKLGQTR